MTIEHRPERTLGEVGQAAATLEALLEARDRLATEHAHDPDLFVPASPAARDAVLRGYRQRIRDTLGFTNLFLAAAFDHGNELRKWGEGAARGNETPVWAPWSVARSLVEVCAFSTWLTEAGITTRSRVSRSLTLSRSEALSRQRLDGESREAEIAELDAEARDLHIPTVRGRGGWLGYEAALPSRSALVRQLFRDDDDEDFRVYSLLSAASHGESWAISQLGYVKGERDAVTGNTMMEKRPSAIWLWAALGLATLALERASDSAASYRGWT